MDKRLKPRCKVALLTERINFYQDIDTGKLSLKDAARKMRNLSGLTQPEFARHRGVSVRVIKELEAGTGNPTIKSLNAIAAIFALEVAFRRRTEDADDT